LSGFLFMIRFNAKQKLMIHSVIKRKTIDPMCRSKSRRPPGSTIQQRSHK
jgi:hypothetical protein